MTSFRLPDKKRRIPDDAYIWFTSMGLAVGILMVVTLLGVIFFNGARAFWPDRAAQVVLKDGSGSGVQGSLTLLGEVKKKQLKSSLAVNDGTGAAREAMEWQMYLGNKDIYGLSYHYLDVEDIENVEWPRDAVLVERMEYGDAVGFPVRLETGQGDSILSSDPRFAEELHVRVEEAARRRRDIKRIEKSDIGRINHAMEGLRLKEKGLSRKSLSEAEAEKRLARIKADRGLLQGKYERLAREAKELRGIQGQDVLVLRLADDREKKIEIGDIVSYYYPNRLGSLQRVGLAVRNFWVFLTEEPREANTEGGIFPAIFGTFVMTLLMSLAVMPFGVIAAIYLREYAREGFLVRMVRVAVNNLAGVPSIVFGVFGLGFFVYFVGGTIDSLFFKDALPTPTYGTGGILWASLTLALMTVPVVIVATEEALAAVSRGVREGSLACGASKWQTIRNVVLPASAPGIMTGLILAMARGAGEVAPLMLVGVVKLAPSLPIDGFYPFVHLDRKFMHLGFHIYDLGFQSPDSEAAKPMVFATTFLLILLVVVLNLAAIVIRERLRRKFMTSAF